MTDGHRSPSLDLDAQPVMGQGEPVRSETPAGRAGRVAPTIMRLLPIGTSMVLIALWQGLNRTGLLAEEISPPSEIARWLGSNIQTSEFWTATRLTMWHWAAGLGLSIVGGVVIGLAIGIVPFIHQTLHVTLELLRPIPAVIYLPVLLLLWGGTSKTAIVLVATGAFWPMLFQTSYGAAAVDPMLHDAGKVFGLSARQRMFRITIPSVLPYVATGVRISSSLALVVAVAVELIGGVPGLGADLGKYSANGVYPGLYGIIIVTGAVGVVLNLLLERGEHQLLHWHISHRAVNS